MDQINTELSNGAPKSEIVPMNGVRVIKNGAGIETHGLLACVAIAGSFESDENIAFMTHRGVQDFIKNLTDVVNVANQQGLRDKSGILFIFRKHEGIAPKGYYLENGVTYSYEQVIDRIREALPHIFPKARIIEANYGNKSVAQTGDAILDLIGRKYRTDIEGDEF